MSSQKQPTLVDSFADIAQTIRKLGLLYIEKGRLKVTERLTILLSTIAFTAVIIAIALILLIFVSIGVGHLLATSIAPHLAYLIIAGFYLLLFVVMVLFRRPFFVNPIARFMSRLLLDEPGEPRKQKRDSVETRLVARSEEGGEML